MIFLLEPSQSIGFLGIRAARRFSTAKLKQKTSKPSCRILQKEHYKNLFTVLEEQKEKTCGNSLKILGSNPWTFILSQNISVSKLALEKEKTIFPRNTRMICTKEVGDGFSEFRIGRFTVKEDSIIIQNWEKLLKEANLEDHQEMNPKEEVFNSNRSSEEDKMMKNLIGHWLSQGLSHSRLSCEVFQRLNILFNTTTGPFSAEEDEIVCKYVQENGRKWKELSEMTGRSTSILVFRYDSYLRFHLDKSWKVKSGKYSLEEDKRILSTVLNHNPRVIEDELVSREVWTDLGSQLGRYPVHISKHWVDYLHPLLVRYKANKLDTDYAYPIVDYMLRNNLEYSRDVDWSALAKLLPGTTGPYLSGRYRSFHCSAKRKYDLKTVEVTAGVIRKYLDQRTKNETQKTSCDRNEAFLSYYEDIVL